MAKNIKAQTLFGEDLEKLAEKFGKIPTSYNKKADIIAAGLLTEEEFDNLPYCPRSTEMESGTKWPQIGERKVYPLSGALTAEESQMYYDYKKALRTGSDGTGKSKTISQEVQTKIDSIKAFLKENGASAELMAQFEEIIPHKKDSLLTKMFGVEHPAQLAGKVNLAYVMFRGPNGEFSEELQPNVGDLWTKGFMPVFTITQVKDNLKKLAEKGVILDGVITDLQ